MIEIHKNRLPHFLTPDLEDAAVHGTVIYFSPDHVVHRGDLDATTRDLLCEALNDAVPLGCHIAGMILDDPATPLMPVRTRWNTRTEPSQELVSATR